MATKKIKLHSSSLPEVPVQTTDWALCALCQQSTSEPLRDPSKAKNKCQSRACETLADNLRSMDELDSLPLSINISHLDDGTGIEATLTHHNAKWHKTCYVMCNKTKVDRVRKKVTKEQTSATSSLPLKGRLRGAFPSTSHQGAEKIPVCFFCDAPVEQDYHKAATKKLDTNVRKMATELKDTLLLAKLSSGDMIATDAVYHKHCLTGLFTRYRSSMRQKESSFGNSKL